MNFYFIEPEVAGDWGEYSDVDVTCHPPVVTNLHYQFRGWLGDSIIESFPCYIVTLPLSQAIAHAKLTGVHFSPATVSKDEQFEEMHPEVILPPFVRLEPVGKAGIDDFGIAPNLNLIVSEQALQIIREHKATYMDVAPFDKIT